MRKIIVFITCFLLINFSYGNNDLIISQWLNTQPLNTVYPTFHETENVEGRVYSNQDLLDFEHKPVKEFKPVSGQTLSWIKGESTTWDMQSADEKGFIQFSADEDMESPRVVFMAAYIEADSWMEADLEVRTPQLAQVYLNGEALGRKSSVETEDGNYGKITQDLKLEKGKHLVLIKSLYTPEDELDWKVGASLKPRENFAITDLNIDTKPVRSKNIHDILEGVKVSWIRPSHGGELYAVAYNETKPPEGDSESWIKIKDRDDKSIVHTFRHASISGFRWLPDSRAVSYITRDDNKSTLHVLDIENGETKTLMEDVEHFRSYRWSEDEEFIIYSIMEDNTDDPGHIRHIIGMQDRQHHWRNRSFLYHLDVETKSTHRLTYGNLSTSLHDISPCGEKILFSQSWPDYRERPFSKQNIYLMDLNTMDTDTMWAEKKWAVSGSFSPGGEHLLFTGGPAAFEKIGKNIPEEMIANNYDTQAYIYSFETQDINPITYDFDPSISSVHWHPEDDHIYLSAQDEDKVRLYRYNVRRERFSEISTPVDVVSGLQYSSGERVAAYIGQGMSYPPKGYWINLSDDISEVIEDTESENYKYVQFGENKEWDYQTSEGVDIAGRVYLPPDFDEEKTYPAIVYYYGGTNPVTRSFGGRYPFDLWSGQGYVVYVLQPSGATGFGQEFSAAHVNNWGKTVADEIIESTKAFLDDHQYVDSERVGCAGASYGGFMTMLLTTETDIFDPAVSHAGISSISSYWGEGYWGYSYSAVATADKYPWDSPEIYVDQSPLFRADKAKTPLLLVTGDEDTNVPPGESIQMYTALKTLGKPAELLKVTGQDHHIIDYQKRIEWNNAILAWFDKWLKDQDEWWKEQFPKKNF